MNEAMIPDTHPATGHPYLASALCTSRDTSSKFMLRRPAARPLLAGGLGRLVVHLSSYPPIYRHSRQTEQQQCQQLGSGISVQ